MVPPALPITRQFVATLLNAIPALPQPSEDVAHENSLSNAPEKTKKQLLSLQVLFPNEFVPALDLLDRRLVTRFRISDDSQWNASANNVDRKATSHREAHVQGREAEGMSEGHVLDADQHGPLPVTATSAGPHLQAHSEEQSPQTIPDNRAEDEAMSDIHPADTQPSHTNHNIVYYVGSAQQRSSRFSTSYDTTTSYQVRLLAWNCSCPAFAFSAFPAMHPEPPISTYKHPREDEVMAEQRADAGTEGEWRFGGISLGDGMPPVCKHLLACVLAEKCSGVFGACVEERVVGVEEAAGWAAGWGD